MAMTLQELINSSYETAVSKGWWDEPRSYAWLTLLMSSEISEALEDYRAGKGLTQVWYEHKGATGPISNTSPTHLGELGKPCGIPSELADVIIRIADFCGHEKLELFPVSGLSSDSFDDALALANSEITKVYIALTQGAAVVAGNPTDSTHRWGIASNLSIAVQRLINVCLANNIDIGKAILEKAAYNKTRPMRHGGKAI